MKAPTKMKTTVLDGPRTKATRGRQSPAPRATRILIETSHTTPERQMFRVYRENGSVLNESTPDPEHDACRALAAEGVRGWLVTRWAGADHDAIRMGILWGARRHTIDTATKGPVVGKLTPSDLRRLPEVERMVLEGVQDGLRDALDREIGAGRGLGKARPAGSNEARS